MDYYIIIGLFISAYLLATLGSLVLAGVVPCKNPKCAKGLPHAYYISDWCPGCNHMDRALQADPSLAARRNMAAYGEAP